MDVIELGSPRERTHSAAAPLKALLKPMRHAYAFPPHIREAVRAYVRSAVEHVEPTRYRQEPAYTSALLSRLQGTVYDGPDGSVVFRATNVDSIGRGAAERWSGADLAITADISREDLAIKKAILAQAKLGDFEELPVSERNRLADQIRNMRRLTPSPKVILIRDINGRREPEVRSGVRILEGLPTKPEPLADYFVRRVLTTLDGDTRPDFVAGVQDSSLKQLRVSARFRG
jgi:hypothetical protein